MSGILTPDKGTVISYSSKFSYVGATPLIISASLRDNLIYGNKNKLDDSELIKMVDEFKVFQNNEIGLDDRISNKNLSSGQMHKISFIRALLSNPEILVLDEATSNLDIESKKIINNYINKLKLTIINSTHNNDELTYDYHYKIEVNNDKKVTIEMTLTSPNCPVAESLPNSVKNNILKIEGIKDVNLKLVWDPPWTKDKMSAAAKLELNL